MKKSIFITSLLLTNFIVFAQAEDLGTYVGKVQTVWLDDGRQMELLEDFSYIDPKGMEWRAPKGSIIDGASIPRLAWSVIGGPFEGRYRNASVIHDVACKEKKRPWETVHEAFYYAMLRSEVEHWRAKTMYYAVYAGGPRWPYEINVPAMNDSPEEIVEGMALRKAAPGSTAEIVYREPIWRVRILPPPTPPTLDASTFEELKGVVIASENRDGGGLSLNDLRSYKPVR